MTQPQTALHGYTPFQEHLFRGLTEEQFAVVSAPITDSILVLAGAGTGKTRTLTVRTANLACQGIDLQRCLCLTFTNRAARELRHRLAQLFGVDDPDDPEAPLPETGTFHGFCARWLRRNAEEVSHLISGRTIHSDFTILDDQDASAALRKATVSTGPGGNRKLHPEHVKAFRRHLENAACVLDDNRTLAQLMRDDDVTAAYTLGGEIDADTDHRKAADILDCYEQTKADNAALDYADLIRFALRAFEAEPAIVPHYETVLVDEYQDTDSLQSRMLACLARGPICCVGDDDQAIYTWRGARIENIYELPRLRPSIRVMHLTQNFRSTQPILDVANAALKANSRPYPKTLHAACTHRSPPPPQHMFFANPTEEADFLMQTARTLAEREAVPYGEQAILARRGRDLIPLDAAAARHAIPYRVTAGHRFSQRAEIRDLTAWLRLLLNPSDAEALNRVLTHPKRGIGDTSLNRLKEGAEQRGIPVADALRPVANGARIQARARTGMVEIADLLEELLRIAGKGATPLQVIETAYLRSGIHRAIGDDRRSDDPHVRESAAARDERVQNLFHIAAEAHSITALCDQLATSDLHADGNARNVLTISTIHAAKGLEYDFVAVVALEDSAFPPAHASDATLEEERRLLHVACTRARHRLLLTRALYRNGQSTQPSPFLGEIRDTIPLLASPERRYK